MNAASWPRVRRILEAAVDCPAHRRDRLLDRACGGDDELRRQVTALLAQRVPSDNWLESPVPGAAAILAEHAQLIGRCGSLGQYRIGEVLAIGGMGVVFRGTDESDPSGRPVAIKVLQRGLCTRRTLRAFRREQRLLQQLDHPNITRFHDSGLSSEGQPYIVMEYVDGEPIDTYAHRCRLSIHQRLELFRSVCLAVHYAHQNLVVHRDLKPGNILVDRSGVVKLLDFGIAKLLHGSAEGEGRPTETMMDAMTLQYSSPEQIRGEPITTGTDVYSLGVILYELLAGRPPYDLKNGSRYEAERQICEVVPPTVQVAADLPRPAWGSALDRIVAMAMHKDARRRYASAEQLAEDLQRYLDGSTVLAYQASRFERTWSALRKHRLAFGVAAASFVIISGLAIVSAFMARSATIARDHEAKARDVSQRINGFMNDVLALSGPARIGSPEAGLHVLQEASSIADRELADQPEIAAGVYLQIGRTYGSLRRRPEAIRNYRSALACFRRNPQADRERLAQCLVSLGGALSYQDDPEGLSLQREALSLRQAMYQDDDLRLAESLHGVAFALTRCARPPRYQEARALYTQALEMRRRLGAGESAAAAENLHAIAALLRHEDRLAESAAQYQRALELHRRVVPPLDSQLVDCLEDYAVCLRELGRFDEAEALLAESVELNTKASDEVSAAWSLANLSDVLRGRGDRPRAWRALHEAMARLGRTVRTDPTAEDGRNWRMLIAEFDPAPAGPRPEAYRSFIRLAPVAPAAGKLSPASYCSLLDRLAGLATDESDFGLAEMLSREAMRMLALHDGSNTLTRIRYQRTLAEALARAGRTEEARALLSDSLAGLTEARGAGYRDTRAVAARLAQLSDGGRGVTSRQGV